MVSSKAAEKKLADLWADLVEAGVEAKRLDDAIKQAKVEIGVALLKEKTFDDSKLKELEEKRVEVGLRLSELGKQINDAKAELREAKG